LKLFQIGNLYFYILLTSRGASNIGFVNHVFCIPDIILYYCIPHQFFIFFVLVFRPGVDTGWHKKNGKFWNTQQKLKNSKKKIYWQKLNHYNLPF